jgi:hypothetical protein
MEAVRVEATAPPAIPFPWLRALPGIAAAAVAFLAVIAGFFALGRTGNEGPVSPAATSVNLLPGAEVAWLLIVALVCTVPVVLSLRITRGHS